MELISSSWIIEPQAHLLHFYESKIKIAWTGEYSIFTNIRVKLRKLPNTAQHIIKPSKQQCYTKKEPHTPGSCANGIITARWNNNLWWLAACSLAQWVYVMWKINRGSSQKHPNEAQEIHPKQREERPCILSSHDSQMIWVK